MSTAGADASAVGGGLFDRTCSFNGGAVKIGLSSRRLSGHVTARAPSHDALSRADGASVDRHAIVRCTGEERNTGELMGERRNARVQRFIARWKCFAVESTHKLRQ